MVDRAKLNLTLNLNSNFPHFSATNANQSSPVNTVSNTEATVAELIFVNHQNKSIHKNLYSCIILIQTFHHGSVALFLALTDEYKVLIPDEFGPIFIIFLIQNSKDLGVGFSGIQWCNCNLLHSPSCSKRKENNYGQSQCLVYPFWTPQWKQCGREARFSAEIKGFKLTKTEKLLFSDDYTLMKSLEILHTEPLKLH